MDFYASSGIGRQILTGVFVRSLAFLEDFGAHSTRLACRFSIYIKYKNVIRLEIFSRKIVLQMTNSLHCPENTRNRFAELNLKILLLLLLLSSLKPVSWVIFQHLKCPVWYFFWRTGERTTGYAQHYRHKYVSISNNSVLYVQEVVTQPKILNQTILYNLVHVT